MEFAQRVYGRNSAGACEVRTDVVDRIMVAPLTSLKLFLTLVLIVYGYLVSLATPLPRSRLAAALAGVVPFAVWLIAPDLLEVGSIDISMTVRRLSLLVGAAAVALRYACVRSGDRTRGSWRLLARVSAGCLCAAVGLGTANWLATAAFAVSAVAVSRIIPSEESADAASLPHRDQRDT